MDYVEARAGESMKKDKILIVDDSEMNRSILADMLGENYEILEAEDGFQAVGILQKTDIALMLLDINMPKLNGFQVLEVMKENRQIESIPVIMVSAESASEQIERAFELGATDFITRPFDLFIVRRRVMNTIMLYAKQKQLLGMVEDQIYEKEQRSNLMIDLLCHIVEFRNGESGPHIRDVRKLTDFFLHELVKRTDKYGLTETDIVLISTASALHDIGKVGIDEKILNKPGRLTDEEYEVMKNHTKIGAQMLDNVEIYKDNPLVKISKEICRWHHERFDGKGYPDGLKGDEIPISAQVVALADVYHALTSVRVYKESYSNRKAIDMILNGECGAFNPILLECLSDNADVIESVLKEEETESTAQQEIHNFAEIIMRSRYNGISERTLQLLDYERMRYNFFLSISEDIQVEYTVSPPMLTLSEWGARKLGVDEVTVDPQNNEKLMSVINPQEWKKVSDRLRETTPEQPDIVCQVIINCGGEHRWHKIIARAVWSDDIPPKFEGALGKAMDIHNTVLEMEELKKKASRDSLTGLLNHMSAQSQIRKSLEEQPDGQFALIIFDLDYFKSANDRFGHRFGDNVLKHIADVLSRMIGGADICARVGGDEFLVFLEFRKTLDADINKIYSALCGKYENFSISLSMGVARSTVVGHDYDALFHAADQALYYVKQTGRGRCCYFKENMKNMLSVISEIDKEED